VHAFVNDLMRPVGTYLYGRRLNEVMRYWETADTEPGMPPVGQDFARVWQAADKIVYSRTLESTTPASSSSAIAPAPETSSDMARSRR
jgi:hypothetical protein